MSGRGYSGTRWGKRVLSCLVEVLVGHGSAREGHNLFLITLQLSDTGSKKDL